MFDEPYMDGRSKIQLFNWWVESLTWKQKCTIYLFIGLVSMVISYNVRINFFGG